MFTDIAYLFRRISNYITFKKGKNKNNLVVREFINNSNLKKRVNSEYTEFKGTIITKLTESLSSKDKIIVRPNHKRIYLFEKLLEDEEFLSYFNFNIINEFNDIEFSINKVE